MMEAKGLRMMLAMDVGVGMQISLVVRATAHWSCAAAFWFTDGVVCK
jgi:hypothetical protein